MKRSHRTKFEGVLSLRTVRKRLFSLVRTPFFWLITFWGNAWVLGGAFVFHSIEGTRNPAVHGFIDSLSWAVGMVTTVGGGAVNPVTLPGKIICIFMMMGGALFIWSYMAVFVGAFVGPELRFIEHEVTEIQHGMEEGERLLSRLRILTVELEGHLVRQRQEHQQKIRDNEDGNQ